jgi:hypothetical protein
MHETGRNLHFVQEIVIAYIASRLRDLQSHSRFVNGVERAIDIGERAGCYASQDLVLAYFLPGFQQSFVNPGACATEWGGVWK